jgi:hypothetical protein
MPSLRLAWALRCRVGEGGFVALAPALLLSRTTSEGLTRVTSSVTQLQLLLGAGLGL